LTSVAAPLDEAYARGDSEAARLYGAYSDRILAFCLRRLGSRSEAEDAVQTTFLYALRALRRGVEPESESAWLHAIAKNVCRWQLRTASRRPLSGDRGLELVASPEPDGDRELLAGLRDALGSLPERQREALVLRELRGLSAGEIAEQLELSAPATHALLTRARHALALALMAPKRATLALASVAYELRSWIKAAVGGASAKAAAVATVAVVGAGAGGVAVERGLGSDRSTPPPSDRVQPAAPETPSAPAAVSPARAAGEPAAGSPAGPPASRRVTGGKEGTTKLSKRLPVHGREQTILGRTRPRAAPAPQGDTAPAPEGKPAPGPRSDLPVAVPLAKPDSPGVAVPPVDLPPVDLPPMDAPSLDLPPVDVPPLDLPTDVVPPVDLPPVDLPPVDLPPVDVPPLDLPPLLPLQPRS
jgi:RNA polymerase sigma factor (sigma-70 family)